MTLRRGQNPFAQRVFFIAGVAGVVIVAPLFFVLNRVGEFYPPAVTHREFYYGFLVVTLAWQFAFLIIARDPVRYRMLMLPSMIEKFGYVAMLTVMYARQQIPLDQFAGCAVDLTLGVLFVIAYLKTPPDAG